MPDKETRVIPYANLQRIPKKILAVILQKLYLKMLGPVLNNHALTLNREATSMLLYANDAPDVLPPMTDPRHLVALLVHTMANKCAAERKQFLVDINRGVSIYIDGIPQQKTTAEIFYQELANTLAQRCNLTVGKIKDIISHCNQGVGLVCHAILNTYANRSKVNQQEILYYRALQYLPKHTTLLTVENAKVKFQFTLPLQAVPKDSADLDPNPSVEDALVKSTLSIDLAKGSHDPSCVTHFLHFEPVNPSLHWTFADADKYDSDDFYVVPDDLDHNCWVMVEPPKPAPQA